MTHYSEELSDRYTKLRENFNASDNSAFTLLQGVGIEDSDILDLGCGDGRYSCKFFELGAKSVKGIDLSPAMISRAKKRDCGVDFIVGNCMDLPYEDERFDIIFSNFVLQHCKDVETPIKEVSRVLRKGGYFCATFNTVVTENQDIYNTEMPLRLGTDDYVMVYDLVKFDEEFEGAFEKAGLFVIKYLDEPNEYISLDPDYPHLADIQKLKTIVCLVQKS